MNRRRFIGAIAAGITTLAVTTRLAFVPEIEKPRLIYVTPNGNGKGTQVDPANIRRALEMAEAGDSIFLTPGYYQ